MKINLKMLNQLTAADSTETEYVYQNIGAYLAAGDFNKFKAICRGSGYSVGHVVGEFVHEIIKANDLNKQKLTRSPGLKKSRRRG
jgi:hypothetical protein